MFVVCTFSQLKDDCLSATTLSCPLIESLILMSCPSVGSAGLYSLRCLPHLTMLDLSYTFLMNLQPVFESCLKLKVIMNISVLACFFYMVCFNFCSLYLYQVHSRFFLFFSFGEWSLVRSSVAFLCLTCLCNFNILIEPTVNMLLFLVNHGWMVVSVFSWYLEVLIHGQSPRRLIRKYGLSLFSWSINWKI